MLVHEFVCDDCEVDVVSFAPADQTVCQLCLTIRDINERDPMTPKDEAALREILGNVRPIKALAKGVYLLGEENG